MNAAATASAFAPLPDAARQAVIPTPRAPASLDESGLTLDLVLQLTLKTLHFAGDLAGNELAARMGLRYHVIEPALDLLKASHHVGIVGGSVLGGAAFRYRITDAGRTRAALFIDQSQYVGAAPVPLADYQHYMTQFVANAPRSASRQRVQEAFAHLVVNEQVIDQIGPAVNAGRSLFIYGPPGNGKTVMSRAIRDLLDGTIAIPHALAVEGQIVRLYDPVNHEAVADEDVTAESLDVMDAPDARWVTCRRPLVMVGGELTMSALQLSHTGGGFYKAPVHVLANGGVLVVDDFGRQQITPTVLLNRWSVPLESRVDVLSLATGQMFEVPFAPLVVFATNLRPSELVDEAFLRRIHAKVYAQSPSREHYAYIFERYCQQRDISFDPAVVDHLLTYFYPGRGLPRRGCHPRDLVDHALALADYRHMPRRLTIPLIDAACAVYFVDDHPVADDSL